jgi:hypothetical protein
MASSILSGLFGSRRYTLNELMAVDQARQEKASRCSVRLLDTFYTLKDEDLLGRIKSILKGKKTRKAFYITYKLQVKSETKNIYNVFIQLDPDFDLSKGGENHVKVYCHCADFKYRSAYILGQRDSLFLNGKTKSDLGDAYKTAGQGKRGTTVLCKHAFAAISWLLQNYNNLMRTL